MRVAVLVEGLHDQWLVEAALRPVLEEAMVGVFPLRGAKGLRSVAEASLLFRGTGAPILIVLDNLMPDVLETWQSVCAAFSAGLPDEAHQLLMRMPHREVGERRWVYELCRAAVDTGRLDRIHLFGMSALDAVCYLPAERLLRPGRTWAEATAAYLEYDAHRDGEGQRLPPKKWWEQNGWAKTFADAAVEAGVRALSKDLRSGRALHPDLAALGVRIRQVSELR